MKRAELVKKTTEILRASNIKKPISIPKHVFYISDDDGNMTCFKVKQTQKSQIYTIADVDIILEACLSVIEDALEHGDEISLYGFGTLALKYWKPRELNMVGTDEKISMKGHYIPKFSPGSSLRRCAKLYEEFLEKPKQDAQYENESVKNSE